VKGEFNMSVGILTIHAAHNYGAMLQAYALQAFLRSEGYDARIIHYYTEATERSNKRIRRISSVRDLLMQLATLALFRKFIRRYMSFDRFMSENLVLTRRYINYNALCSDMPKFDTYIVGSDQIWNMDQGGDPAYFLQLPLPTTSTRVSYAPSFGNADTSDINKKKLSSWLEPFDSISIREDSGADLVEQAVGYRPEVILDPVFLLPRNSWGVLCKPTRCSLVEYIAFYALEVTPLAILTVRFVSRALGLPVVILGKSSIRLMSGKTLLKIDSGPGEFLEWIRRATLVCTSSFHALAFSIIFQRAFVVVAHSTRNTRLSHLLNQVGLADRMISSPMDLEGWTKTRLLNCNYEAAEKKLEDLRRDSAAFLFGAIPLPATGQIK